MQRGALVIRKATRVDLPAMLDLYNDAVRTLPVTFDLEEQTLEARSAWFERFGGPHPLVVAEVDGRVSGYASLAPFRNKPGYAQTVELSVYVAREAQRQGIGKALVGDLLRRARQIGHHVIVAGVVGGNTVSVKLHEKFGFEYVGCFREVGFKFGAWRDVHFYQLILS